MATRRLKRTPVASEDVPRHGDPVRALAALGSTAYWWDRASDRLTWGPNAASVLGLPAAGLPATGQAYRNLVEPASGRTREEALSRGETDYDLHYALRTGPGAALLVQDSGRVVPGSETILRGSLRSDVLARDPASLPRRIQEKSAFLSQLQNDIAEAIRFRHGATLIVCQSGEDAAPDGAGMLRLARPLMRRRDHAVLLSPCRFALVLTSCSLTDSAAAGARLRALMEQAGPPVRIALASAPDHGLDACALLRRCEEILAIEDAPRPERDDPLSQDGASFDIARALNDRALYLTMNPIVDGHCRTPAFRRAVPRIPGFDPFGAAIGPDMALLMDARALELAADELAGHPELRIILPVGAPTLRNSEWLPVLAAHLGARPGIASRLTIALPDPVLVEKSRVLGRLDAMKALGVGVAIDGFGGGHATATRLRSLPVDLVTIDGIFVKTLSRSIGDRHFVRTLIDIAQQSGIAVAAEWVDDEATASRLAGWGVDYMEGALFGGTAASPQRSADRRRA